MSYGELRVEIEPAGPEEAAFAQIPDLVREHPRLQERVAAADVRLLGMQPADPDGDKSSEAEARAGESFRATLYDYANDRAIEATGSAGALEELQVEEYGRQPLPNREEFRRAVQLLAEDSSWREGLGDQAATPIPHVPPVIAMEQPDGRTRRMIGVALVPPGGRGRFRVAAVDIFRGEIVEVEPSGGEDGDCGFEPVDQDTVTGTLGQAWISVWQGGTRLWRFLARRPAGSSGTNGSGIELRYVDYRDKRVLWQAHVPILNVKYDEDACGPFLDWQNQETPFQADGTDPVPGFRLCDTPAKSILEAGSDSGNFTGVAVFVDGQEVVLLSEMQAGWYRYISSWRFHADGTIRPRFGFSAVQFPCVCNRHHHHCYWRLDFDIRTPNNVVAEFNDPPLVEGWGNWHDKTYEIQRPRDDGHQRRWRVTDPESGAGYDIVPGQDDGVATESPDWPFPQGDVWIVRWKPGAEIDNGVVATGPPFEANIGNFMNGELIHNQDVVIWYGAHFTHQVTEHAGHIVGPDLVPVNWP
jgi:hypothetical protein